MQRLAAELFLCQQWSPEHCGQVPLCFLVDTLLPLLGGSAATGELTHVVGAALTLHISVRWRLLYVFINLARGSVDEHVHPGGLRCYHVPPADGSTVAAAWLTTGSAATEHLQAFMLSFMAAQAPAGQQVSILALLGCMGQPGMRPGRPLMLPLLLAAVAATQAQAPQRLPAFQKQVLSMLEQRCADLSQGTTATERSEACQGTAGCAHACPLSLTLSACIGLILNELHCLQTNTQTGKARCS